MELLKKVVKNTLLFGAVGVVLALLTPVLMPLATSLGVSAAFATATLASTSAVWSGIFFGAFGALAALATPVFDGLFHDGPSSNVPHSPNGLGMLKARSRQVQADVAADINGAARDGTHFQEMLAARGQDRKISL